MAPNSSMLQSLGFDLFGFYPGLPFARFIFGTWRPTAICSTQAESYSEIAQVLLTTATLVKGVCSCARKMQTDRTPSQLD